ncbi:MAG: hypothetical protein ACFB4I_09810 [Cyanophyceae cyanobacterium]
MKVWMACFAILFVLAELGLWIREFLLPVPVYVLGGAFLAIASNYEHRFKSGPALVPTAWLSGWRSLQTHQPEMPTASVGRLKAESAVKPQ